MIAVFYREFKVDAVPGNSSVRNEADILALRPVHLFILIHMRFCELRKNDRDKTLDELYT